MKTNQPVSAAAVEPVAWRRRFAQDNPSGYETHAFRATPPGDELGWEPLYAAQLPPREPTDAMSLAGKHYMKGQEELYERRQATGCWRVMYDAWLASATPEAVKPVPASKSQAKRFAAYNVMPGLMSCNLQHPSDWPCSICGTASPAASADEAEFERAWLKVTDCHVVGRIAAREIWDAARARPAAPVTTDLPPAPTNESDDALVSRLKRETAIFRSGKAAAPVIAPGEAIYWANPDALAELAKLKHTASINVWNMKVGPATTPLYLSPPAATGSEGAC